MSRMKKTLLSLLAIVSLFSSFALTVLMSGYLGADLTGKSIAPLIEKKYEGVREDLRQSINWIFYRSGTELMDYLNDNYAAGTTNIAIRIINEADQSLVWENFEPEGTIRVSVTEEKTIGKQPVLVEMRVAKLTVRNQLALRLWFLSFVAEYRGWLYGLLALSLLSAVGSIILLIRAIGHQKGKEGLTPALVDRVYPEVWYLLWYYFLIQFQSARYQFVFNNLSRFAALVILTVIALRTTIYHVKAKDFWASSLCHQAVKLMKQLFRELHIRWIVPLVWLIGLLIILFFQVFPFTMFLLWSGLVLVGAAFYLRHVRDLRMIRSSLSAISENPLTRPKMSRPIGTETLGIAQSLVHFNTEFDVAIERTTKSERMKSELIANVSHDLKTPLTSIISYVDLLDKCDLADPQARSYLDVLKHQSARMKKLTDDLLEVSKAASGDLPINHQVLDLSLLVRQCLGEYEDRFTDHHLTLRMNLPESAWVDADGTLLWRVIDNLLRNVEYYALANTRVWLDLEQNGQDWMLTLRNVSEQPIDVEPEQLTERFVRADPARSTEGSGLGLAIAENLMRQMGGTMQVSTDGDLFKVILTFTRIQSPEKEDQT